jgi:hypothetical protein
MTEASNAQHGPAEPAPAPASEVQPEQHQHRPKPNGQPQRRSALADGVPPWALFTAAAILLALFVAFVIFLLVEATKSSVGETQWTRMYLVYGTAEAIAFTVVGWLFGRQVSRTALRSSKEQLDSARQHEHDARDREQRAQQHAAQAHDQARVARDEARRHELVANQFKERARAFLVMAPGSPARASRMTAKVAAGTEPPPADDLVARAEKLFDL